jgi:hypothetical protein
MRWLWLWLRRLTRRLGFAFNRSLWDTADAVGDHALFAALVSGTLVVLAVVFVSTLKGSDALWGLAAVWLVVVIYVVFKFARALVHPDVHPTWDWGDYGLPDESWMVEARSLAPLRARRISRREAERFLRCRVVAPDGCVSRSTEPVTFGPLAATAGTDRRHYPEDFRDSRGRTPPAPICTGRYEVAWWQPSRGPFARPLLMYAQRKPLSE